MKIEGLVEAFNKASIDGEAYSESTLVLLRSGAYHVGYSFDESHEEIHYIAYADCLRDVSLLTVPYIEAIVRLDGSIIPNRKDFVGKSDVDQDELALIAYVIERDAKFEDRDSEGYEAFYAPIEEAVAATMALPEEERLEREEARNAFIRCFRSAVGSFSDPPIGEKPKEPYQIAADLHALRGGSYEISLDLLEGDKKIMRIPSGAPGRDFLSSYRNGGNYMCRTKLRSLNEACFGEAANKVMSFLIALGAFYRQEETKGFVLSRDESVAFVSLFNGMEIHLEGVPYYVTKDTLHGYLSLNEDESLELSPSRELAERCFLLSSKRDLLLWNATSRVVEHYEFKDEMSLKMYVFFINNPKAKVSYVKDLLLKEGAFEMAFSPQTTENHHLGISLYVDIDEEGHLSFKTVYSLFGEPKDRDFLLASVFYKAVIKRYEEELKRVGGLSNGLIKDEDKIIAFLQADLGRLKKTCRVYLSERFGKVHVTGVGTLNVRVAKTTDWLSLSLTSDRFSSEELQSILAAYKKKKKFILLRDRAVLLKDEELSDALRIKEEAKLDKSLTNRSLPTYEAFKLASMEGQLALDLGTYCLDLIRDLSLFKERKLNFSLSLAPSLRPYQVDAVKWLSVLHQYELGGILADDMGLGKTLETISFLSLLGDQKPSLIIAPKSVVYNWESEFHKWAPQEKVIVIDGLKADRRSKIFKIKDDERVFCITSYDSLRSDIEYYEKKPFNAVVVDEAQYIKNGLALKSKAVRSLKSRFRLALTGTPIENSLSDLWSIFAFLMPGYLDSFPIFKTRYILAGNQTEARARLSKKVAPFILRRTKSEVLKDLPSKSVGVVRLTMNEEAKRLYEATVQDAREKLQAIRQKDHERSSNEVFSMLPVLTKLREICVDPAAFLENFTESSSKLDYASSFLRNALLGGHKVLVFSAFTKVLDHLQRMLSQNGTPSYYIHGGIDAKTRLALSQSFNEEKKVNAMLVSLKAGGTGLNLHGADIVIHLDPWWNAAAEEQATDRAYRIGQKRPVSVIKLICHDSIEEKVLALQESKQSLYSAIIHSGDEAITGLSLDDISFLLGA